MEHLLATILKLSPVWMTCSTLDVLDHRGWCPSHADLVSVGLSCLSSLLYKRTSSHPSIAAEDNYSAANRDLKDIYLCRLLSLGLQAETSLELLALRWLSISIANSVASKVVESESEGLVATVLSPSIKRGLVRTLYQCIQYCLQSLRDPVSQSVNNPDKLKAFLSDKEGVICRQLNPVLLNNPVTLSLILDTLAAIGCTHSNLYNGEGVNRGKPGIGRVTGAGCVVKSISSQCSDNNRRGARFSTATRVNDKKDDEDFLPIPEFVQWLAEIGTRKHKILIISLCRFVGRLFDTSINSQITIPAVASSEKTLTSLVDIIIKYITTNELKLADRIVMLHSMVALWRIVHNSEKAKSLVKSTKLCSVLVDSSLVEKCSKDVDSVSDLVVEAYYALHRLLAVVP